MSLSQRVLGLTESETLAMSRRANELKDKGVDVINMSLGEPDFKTPDVIKQAAKAAIDADFSYYTPVPGYKDLQAAIARKFQRDNNLTYAPGQIVVSTGAKQSIINVIMAIVNPGDEVVLPAPYWVSYAEMVTLFDGTVTQLATGIDTDFKVTPALLEKTLTQKTKAFLFSSPCNPTGTTYTEAELRALGEVFKKFPNLVIISDEIYEHINFMGPNFSLASIPELYDRTVTVNGLSKGFAMTGWRLGFIGAPKAIADACVKIQGQFTSGACSITQRAAITAMEMDPRDLAPMRNEFLKRRDLLVRLFREVPDVQVNNPQGAFYLFPKVDKYFGRSDGKTTIKDAKELCLWLLEEAHVALTPGGSFGAPEYFRLSYATSEDKIAEAVKRIKTALAKLK
ncbi:MAG: pyridoxal phosphate-dependent aminotransferase [Bacteriovoracia bacterium]